MLVLNSWAGSLLAGEKTAILTVQANLVPTSCEVKFNGNGASVLNFKDVVTEVNNTGRANLKITCNNKTLAAISVTDNAKNPEHITKKDEHFVLVGTNNQQQGYFSIKAEKPVVDGESNGDTFLISSRNGELESNS